MSGKELGTSAMACSGPLGKRRSGQDGANRLEEGRRGRASRGEAGDGGPRVEGRRRGRARRRPAARARVLIRPAASMVGWAASVASGDGARGRSRDGAGLLLPLFRPKLPFLACRQNDPFIARPMPRRVRHKISDFGCAMEAAIYRSCAA
jgi:hypothetical protein